jgi:hypothetical protein
MEVLPERQRVEASLLDSPFKYFAHLRRPRGGVRIRKHEMLTFPEKCSMCASEPVHGHIGIGRASLFVITNIGYIPYCRDHYRIVSAVQEHRAFVNFSMLIALVIALTLGIQLFGLDDTRAINNLAYYIFLPTFVLARFLANRQFRRKMDLDEDSEKLIEWARPYYAYIFLGLAVMTAAHFTGMPYPHILAAIIVFYMFFKVQIERQTAVERIMERDRTLEKGAVHIVWINPKFYSLGFINRDFYLEFLSLNREFVIHEETHNAIRTTQDI